VVNQIGDSRLLYGSCLIISGWDVYVESFHSGVGSAKNSENGAELRYQFANPDSP
jgi:hypothetical protein